MRRIILNMALSMFVTCFSFSQKIRISGYIIDEQTGEALIGAGIFDEFTGRGSVSNQYGYYSLFVNRETESSIQFSYIGYIPQKINLNLNNDTVINIALKIDNYELQEVVVKVSPEKKIEERSEIGKIVIPISKIKLLPTITGESDILKVYQFVPGIQSGTEGNNGLYVRGGTPDQNLFLLDDVPLYNVSHLGGMFSIFDPAMVKNITMYKGGFPARYGGRISSVVDVRNKEGNLYKYNGELGLSLLLSKIFIEGPINKKKSSFAFSARKSNLDIYSFLYNKILSNHQNQGITFYDINFKSNLKISQKNRLFLSVYLGKDKIFSREKDVKIETAGFKYSSYSNLNWGNSAASIRWFHLISDNVYNNVTLAYTKYAYNNENYYSRTESTDNTVLSDELLLKSNINDVILKNDTEIQLDNSKVRFGLQSGEHFYVPNFVSYLQKYSHNGKDSTLNSPGTEINLMAFDIFSYVEWEYKFNSKLSANMGFRTGYYFLSSTTFPSYEPRIVLNYLFLPSVSIKASYCKMKQNIHLLTNSNTGLPSDIWVPSTASLKPESSNQYSLGLAHTTKNGYELSLEAYFKQLGNLIEYKEGALIYNDELTWEEKVEGEGSGKASGVEVMINKNLGKLTGWIGYSLSSNKRTFKNINEGKEFPFKYEQRHNISIVGNYTINKALVLTFTWVYHTGNRITLPSGKYQLHNINYYDSYEGDRVIYSDIHIYSEKNGYTMPSYHKLDVGLNYTKKKEKGTAVWTVGVYNTYNRQNAYYLFFKESKNGETKLYQQSLYPILLNFGYTYKF